MPRAKVRPSTRNWASKPATKCSSEFVNDGSNQKQNHGYPHFLRGGIARKWDTTTIHPPKFHRAALLLLRRAHKVLRMCGVPAALVLRHLWIRAQRPRHQRIARRHRPRLLACRFGGDD